MTEKTDATIAKAADKVVDATADAIKTAARTSESDKSSPRKKATGPVKAYVKNDGPVYVDNRFYKAGEKFVTNQPKGDGWEEVSAKEGAAIDASTHRVPESANLEEAGVQALQAVAIVNHVNIRGIANDKKALTAAIQAAYSTKL